MDLDTIKQLMQAMEENQVTRLLLKEESGSSLELERSSEFHVRPYVDPQPQSSIGDVQVEREEKNEDEEEKKDSGGEEELGSDITSPMVGTFYLALSPDDPPCVSVGDVVKEDTVVCVIEAMKVMNEVKAGKNGKISKVYIDNAQPVEFGTKLFRVEG